MTCERHFEFDEADPNLELIPFAARRVLDHLGAKLTLEGWQSLSIVDRRTLLRLGCAEIVDEIPARSVLLRSSPVPRATDPIGDPPVDQAPRALEALLGPGRPLPNDVWSNLDALERWALDKVARGKHPERLVGAYDEIIGARRRLTHLDSRGEAHMVSVSRKAETPRRAVATTTVTFSQAARRALLEGEAPKGDVLGAARIAGIAAAKRTSDLIPLCHPIRLTGVEVSLMPLAGEAKLTIRAEVTAFDRTGVEMEAMVAASVAALTVYDMLKAVDRRIEIGPTRLLEKSGGKSGDFRA